MMSGLCLVLAVCCLALLHGAYADGSCLTEAHQAGNAGDIQHWTRGSRQLPNVSDHSHGYGDWKGILTSAPTADEISCMASVRVYLMFKVVNRTVYQLQVPHSAPYSSVYTDMLLLAVWLYTDFPDIDLFFYLADESWHTRECASLPFLLMNPISDDGIRPPIQAPFRGYAVPLPDSWQELSMNTAGLERYAACVDARYSGGWSNRTMKVQWRGSTTGPHTHDTLSQSLLQWVLTSYRVRMCLIADGHDWFDVGVTHITHHEWCPHRPSDACPSTLISSINEALVKPGMPLEAVANYQFSMNIDGHGSAFRLPKLFLLGSVVLQVTSSHTPWFVNRVRPDIHYIKVNGDLSNLVDASRHAIDHSIRKLERYEVMSRVAREEAIKFLNINAQLDSFMWAVLKVKEAQQWPVQAPGKGWQQVKFSEHSWIAKGIPTGVQFSD